MRTSLSSYNPNQNDHDYSFTLPISSAYKSSAADSLLAERGRIDSSHQMTDTIIQYVFDTLSVRQLWPFLTAPLLIFQTSIRNPFRIWQTASEHRKHKYAYGQGYRCVYTHRYNSLYDFLTMSACFLRHYARYQQPHWHDQVTAEAGFNYFGIGNWYLYDSAIDLRVELSSSMALTILMELTGF